MFAFLLIATVFVGSLEGRLEYGAPTNSNVVAVREAEKTRSVFGKVTRVSDGDTWGV